jgi:3-mercaptopyruvate sulfurtransferase SseA
MLLAVAGMGSCSAPKTSDRDLVMVGVEEAQQLAETGGGLRIRRPARVAWVDPRSEEEFRKERIAGAILLPLDRARDDHEPLREYDVLIVYGNDFNSPRAAAVAKLLIEHRHRDVRVLRGGLRAWNAAGYPVESGG